MRAAAVLTVISILLLSGCGDKEDLDLDLKTADTVSYESANPEVKNTDIYVYVCGEVHKPDVYCVSSDTRVFEVIQLAGGLTGTADGSQINQAETVTDGEKIYVPTAVPFNGQAEMNDDGLVNINTADEDELMTLNGVGQSRADAIIAYREEHGRFEKIEDLKNVAGIKEGLFSKIKDHIKVG